MPEPTVIDGQVFETADAAIAHARAILGAGPSGSELIGPHAYFAEALLCARADPLLDLHGLNVIRYLRGGQDNYYAAELEDGTKVEFDFVAPVRALASCRPGAEAARSR